MLFIILWPTFAIKREASDVNYSTNKYQSSYNYAFPEGFLLVGDRKVQLRENEEAFSDNVNMNRSCVYDLSIFLEIYLKKDFKIPVEITPQFKFSTPVSKSATIIPYKHNFYTFTKYLSENVGNIIKKICPLRGHILIARSSLRSQVWARQGRAIRSSHFALRSFWTSRFALGLVLFAYI